MLDNNCKYGALSTYNGTRFLSASNRDHVEISEVIMADATAVTLRRAFAYWLVLCTGRGGLLTYGDVERGTKRKNLETKSAEKASTVSSFPSSSTHLPSDTVLKSGVANELLQFIHDHFVDWSELEILGCLGAGRTGSVALVRWGGLKLALKLLDVGKHGIEDFERETRAYARLKNSNARVAKLMLVTHSPSGQVPQSSSIPL